MRFAHPQLAVELDAAPLELKAKALEFDTWLRQNGMPEAYITCILRTPEENQADNGVPNSLHLDGRAIDFRCVGSEVSPYYSNEQRARAELWLRQNCARAHFELVLKVHGTGPHWHLGLRRMVVSPLNVA